MNGDGGTAFLVFVILFITFMPFLYITIYEIQHDCFSSNLELLNKIIDYGNEIGTCVCDRDTCLYVCEEMKKEYNFSDNCKDVCVPSECFRVMIW